MPEDEEKQTTKTRKFPSYIKDLVWAGLLLVSVVSSWTRIEMTNDVQDERIGALESAKPEVIANEVKHLGKGQEAIKKKVDEIYILIIRGNN